MKTTTTRLASMGQVVMMVLFLVALLLCTTTTASSSTVIPSCQYYVSAQRGQDSNGGSLAAPFRSLQHALQLIVINNGDLSEVAVCVEAGTYSISSANLTTQRFLIPSLSGFITFLISRTRHSKNFLFFWFWLDATIKKKKSNKDQWQW